MPKRDIYQEITDKMIAAIKKGTPPWQAPWIGGGCPMPRRSTGEAYKGINVLLLWSSAMDRGYSAPHWFTYKQAKAIGAQGRKGERGAPVVYFSTFEREADDGGDPVKIPFLKQYSVFNACQIDDLPDQFAPKVDAVDTGARPVAELERFFAATGADVVEGHAAFYEPAADRITMPPIQRFHSPHGYYGVLAHELVHWTGAEHRLDRSEKCRTLRTYAFEELVAEIGACILCQQIGADKDLNHAASYVESWLKALENDKTFIFKAASKAQAAADYAVGLTLPEGAKAAA